MASWSGQKERDELAEGARRGNPPGRRSLHAETSTPGSVQQAGSALGQPVSSAVGTIVLRAQLSADEWRELRHLALDLNASVPQIAGRAIRELLQLHGRPVEGNVKT